MARTVAHTVDVDGMLDTITREQFNEWLAEFTIEPWGLEFAGEPEEEKPSALAMMRQQAGV